MLAWGGAAVENQGPMAPPVALPVGFTPGLRWRAEGRSQEDVTNIPKCSLDTFSECFLLARGKRNRLKSAALFAPAKDTLEF